jgi:hypothetical protein
MRTGRRDQQADLVDAEAGVKVSEGSLNCLCICACRFIKNTGRTDQTPQQIARIRELRNHFRIRIRRRFDSRKADVGEAFDERALGRGRDEGRLVLQPVAGEAFAEHHVRHS